MVMKALHRVRGPVPFRADVSGQSVSVGLDVGPEQLANAVDQLVDGEELVGDRFMITGSGLGDHGPPEGLIAEEGDDHGRLPTLEPDGGGTGPSVMNDGADARKDPVVWGVVEQEDVVRDVPHAESSPSLADEGANAGPGDGLEDDGGEAIGVVDDDTAEADVDGRRPPVQKVDQGIGRLKGAGQVEEDETGHVDLGTPIVGFGDESGRPQVAEGDLLSKQLPRSPEGRQGVETERLDAELVDEVAEALPDDHLHQRIAHEVGVAHVDVGPFDGRQRVGKFGGGRLREGEHEMQGNPQPFGAMDMGEAGRVGDDGIRLRDGVSYQPRRVIITRGEGIPLTTKGWRRPTMRKLVRSFSSSVALIQARQKPWNM